MSGNLASALMDFLLELGGLVVAVTALIKVRTAAAKGDSAATKSSEMSMQLENLKHRIDGEYKSDIVLMKQKLDNDYAAINTLRSKTEAQGTSLATLTQRVDVVEKLVEKVDRLTEIVISVRTLMENNKK